MNDEQDTTERYFFFSKVQMLQSRMNSYLNLPLYSLICM